MNFMRRVRSDSEAFLLFAICSFDLFFLLHAVSTVSIGYYEARIFYDSDTLSGIFRSKRLCVKASVYRLPSLQRCAFV